MQSKASDVAGYLAEVPESRRATLDALRELCQKVLVGSEEGISHGMPTYTRDGQIKAAFASQKNYVSIYINPEIVNAHRAELTAASIGKSCIRFKKPEHIDLAVIEKLLIAVRDSAEAAC